MRRIAPFLFLLALAACGGGPATPPAALHAASAPPAIVKPPPPAPAAVPPPAYVQDVDALLRSLAASDVRTDRVAPDPDAAAAPAAVIYSAPRGASPVESDAVESDTAQPDPYQQNLDACLDGRFPAFCDHAKLTAYDAERTRAAEVEANLVTCIDPEWQHLCRPELLPEVMAEPVTARAAPTPPPSPKIQHATPPARLYASPPAVGRPVVARPLEVPPALAAEPEPAMPPATIKAAAPPRTAVLTLSTAAIAQRLIAASIAAYTGSCPCPYFQDRGGRSCGRRSAYSRGGGYSPICFAEDVTPSMVKDYRERHAE